MIRISFFFCIGHIGHADVPRLCLLRKTNEIARIIGTKLLFRAEVYSGLL